MKEIEKKETKLENLRKKRKQNKERNELFSPLKQKKNKKEIEKENIENPFIDEKLFKYEKEEELKNFSFNISPLKSINTKILSPSPKMSTRKRNLNQINLKTNTNMIINDQSSSHLGEIKKKKEISTSRMKLPTSMNKMKEKSKIPIKKESNLKTLHGKERLNIKSTAIPFETKWKKYLQNK